MILAIFPADDLHGLRVAQRLTELNAEHLVLDASRLHEQWSYGINPLSEDFSEGRVFCKLADPSGDRSGMRIRSIYWRRPWMSEQAVSMRYPTTEQLPAAEACHVLRLALEALPEHFFPLGHPVPLDWTANKILQLRLAKEHGFAVPETMIGNDAQTLVDFLNRHPRIVVKPLHANASWKKEDREILDQMLWCRGLDASFLLGRLQPGQKAQLLLQSAVRKKRDWRITVLPHTSICCEIDTSSLPLDQPDWRKHSLTLPHSIVAVTADFDAKLRFYLKALGLKAGYFDFSVDEQGTPVFLEVNTNANWLWIEELTGYPVSTEIARALIAGGKPAS